jgi:translocator protein
MNKLVKALLFAIACELAGGIGSIFAFSSLIAWYPLLKKPFFNPPNWIFGPVWIMLYALMGVSAYLIWSKGFRNKGVKLALSFFSLQLFLNVIWSVIFFGLRSLFYGLIDIAALWIVLLVTIIQFYKISKKAALLMLPYLAWVTFAMILNFYIWRLN